MQVSGLASPLTFPLIFANNTRKGGISSPLLASDVHTPSEEYKKIIGSHGTLTIRPDDISEFSTALSLCTNYTHIELTEQRNSSCLKVDIQETRALRTHSRLHSIMFLAQSFCIVHLKLEIPKPLYN